MIEVKNEDYKMASKFINLTPHSLTFVKRHDYPDHGSYDVIDSIPSQGISIRLKSYPRLKLGEPLTILDNGIKVIHPPQHSTASPNPHNLRLSEDKGLIVSSMVAEYWIKNGFRWKSGIYSPDSGPVSVIRYPSGHEKEGEIIGIQRLIKWDEKKKSGGFTIKISNRSILMFVSFAVIVIITIIFLRRGGV